MSTHNIHFHEKKEKNLSPCPAEPGFALPCKQCRSRSVGFWRSQLIWICTVWLLSMWIYSNNLDQVIWLAVNWKWAWHLNLISRTRVTSVDGCKIPSNDLNSIPPPPPPPPSLPSLPSPLPTKKKKKKKKNTKTSLAYHTWEYSKSSGKTAWMPRLTWTFDVRLWCNGSFPPCLIFQDLLCFRHLSESRFWLGALRRRNKFSNFCHDLMQNHLL